MLRRARSRARRRRRPGGVQNWPQRLNRPCSCAQKDSIAPLPTGQPSAARAAQCRCSRCRSKYSVSVATLGGNGCARCAHHAGRSCRVCNTWVSPPGLGLHAAAKLPRLALVGHDELFHQQTPVVFGFHRLRQPVDHRAFALAPHDSFAGRTGGIAAPVRPAVAPQAASHHDHQRGGGRTRLRGGRRRAGGGLFLGIGRHRREAELLRQARRDLLMRCQPPRPLRRTKPLFRRRLLAVVRGQGHRPQFRVQRQRAAWALAQGGKARRLGRRVVAVGAPALDAPAPGIQPPLPLPLGPASAGPPASSLLFSWQLF